MNVRKPFKKKQEDPAREDEDEDLRQFMKDRAKKPPSKKIEDDDSAFSFLTPDNEIVQQPSSRRPADANSSSAVDSPPVEINMEAMKKEMDEILFEHKQSLRSSARRPGSSRGKSSAAIRRMTPSARFVGPMFLLAV